MVVTQKEDGGWWEGTLGDKTGWFPSNYVREYKPQSKILIFNYLEFKIMFGFLLVDNVTNNKVPNPPIDLTEQLRSNRAVVVMDIIESERAHVTELKTLIQSFLIPLKNSNMYSKILLLNFIGLHDIVQGNISKFTF